MIPTAVIACLIALSVQSSVHKEILQKFENGPTKELFKVFHYLHGKEYDLNSEEGVRRYRIFKENLKNNKAHNANPMRSYDKGITEYSDMTEEEFRSKHPRSNSQTIQKVSSEEASKEYFNFDKFLDADDEDEIVPERTRQTSTPYAPIDWVSKGYNTTVRKAADSWVCDSSYVLALAYQMEAWNFQTTNTLTEISPQNLIDCTAWDCTQYTSNTPAWLSSYKFLYNNGMYLNSQYPFTGQKGTCNSSTISGNKFAPKKWEFAYQGDYDTDTVYAALQRGPLFFCLSDFMMVYNYNGGIYTDYQAPYGCQNYFCTDGGALLVGYGVDSSSGSEYWVAKTTLGSQFGENGYVRFARNDTNKNMGLNCGYLRPFLD